MGPRQALPWTVLGVLAVTVALLWPVLHAQALNLDDGMFLDGAAHPRPASVVRAFTEVSRPRTVGGYYLPLSIASLMLDTALGGRPDDLTAFHRTNLVLHALAVGLVLVLLLRLFGSLPAAALAALIFAFHPVQVEPLAWVAERKTLLAALFSLLALLGHVERARGGARAWRVLSVIAFLLALLSKPTATLLPVLLLLIDLWPLGRLGRRAVIEKWPYFALAALSAAVTLISNASGGTHGSRPEAGYLRWPLQAADLLGLYLGKLAWPANLSSVYPHRGPWTLANPAVAWGALATLALTALGALLWKRTRGPLVGWTFFLVATFPVLGLVWFSPATSADKYMYLPMLGLLLPLCAGLARAWQAAGARRATALAAALLVLGAEAAGTRAALAHWRDSVTLWRHMARVAPREPLVHNLAGVTLGKAGLDEEAYQHFKASVALNPEWEESRYNLALMLAGRGDLSGAARHFAAAARLAPANPDPHAQLGEVYRRMGRPDSAAAEYERALRLAPAHPLALQGLGRLEMASGRSSAAIRRFEDALRANPRDAATLVSLGSALSLLPGRLAEAGARLEAAVREAPDWPVALNALAWFRATTPGAAQRDSAEALRLSERAVGLSGGRDPNVLDTRAAALASAGRFEEAQRAARAAAELAGRAGATDLAREIEARAAVYGRRQPWREGPAR